MSASTATLSATPRAATFEPGSPRAATQKKETAGLALWMDRVLEECDHAANGFAADPVHDLRVALRRCRSVADGLKTIDPDPAWKKMKKAGKQLFSNLGNLRDVQVMEEWVHRLQAHEDPTGLALLKYFGDREAGLKTEAAKALAEFDRKQWKKWASTLPGRAARLRTGSILFKHLALERWIEAHDLHLRALRNRSGVAFHNLRIGIKRFRYIIENFLPEQHAAWCDDLKKLQDALGEVHDLDVLWFTAVHNKVFPDAEARLRWHSRIQEERSKRIQKYREKMVGKSSLWYTWRAGLLPPNQVAPAALARLKLWASLLDPDFKHSDHVAQLALQLYDGLPSTPASNNGDSRDILQVAAWMHEIGRSKKEKNHHKASFRLITGLKPPLGCQPQNLREAAAVARYHRGLLPRAGQPPLKLLTLRQRKDTLRLAGILRLANAFDSSHDGRVQRLQVQHRNGYIEVAAQGYSSRDRDAERIAAARHLLETIYRRPILVKPA
jgi:CHAD domain-containing protein/HD superfamily phosphodiesterase